MERMAVESWLRKSVTYSNKSKVGPGACEQQSKLADSKNLRVTILQIRQILPKVEF